MKHFVKIVTLLYLSGFTQAHGIIFNFEQTNNWGSGYQASITVENDEDTDLEDWEVSFSLTSKITSSWDSNRVQSNFADGLWNYTFTAFSYQNSTLGAGDSAVIQYVAGAAPTTATPTNVVITGSNSGDSDIDDDSSDFVTPDPAPAVDGIAISYVATNEWLTGATINITISNSSEVSLDNWIVGFELDRSITSSWNSVQLLGDYDADYAFGAPSYAETLAAGQSYTFGMNLGNGFGSFPENLRLVQSNGITVVPEPSNYAIILSLSILLFAICRRRSR
ncbi:MULTISPECIES: cellulose binding domain-containing protein [unclassified Lentimonas]|uniref:cellulose binding domain-containing protein n=1 Tax=unclassified Lentimonas TaxID=2630993 RepID=UPI0013207F20|nr:MULTISPECIES: cellulose binding domain-containing protein [unclassified Lentimonas]CAA6678395.1 Unannotated [Lentimonas sp. CC4]CAA6685487.1 Unannotated [Lentimonas sp. CC6]CAA6690528.1 Unannotated [Lentimonas sp. CC10]CAA6693288.1 Unannotated [Lentimonas sp. CC19]CAA7068785.1 Unannotated [Lentimonas sp. CC11]